ncbi:hypothetical protein P171DRAFT_430645 [Karstenula rhodostoma CBS 690.94]|uniref:Pre-rRNA-processing protein RIX1 n=1 Tax=Karstenula rhodostoma CBS 690.94 TaxID=1392251 RepID=A0A9P4PPE9_9PLEO|nr:hypothetical protein P171DRAFT_430645 [Karstenula rhodostoma CBS 690.94]
MATMAHELATLRALTFRISSTTTSQLPQHVPAIAASLPGCRTLLSSAQASTSKTASEASVAVHKYRTLLSTLLQDRTIQGRWAAVVLIKSTIEIGGWETLQKSLPWVRGLLGILTKPDPYSSKQLCIITLTRIFFLTREYPSLVREITTPSLSPFIQSALQVAASKSSPALLETILESFNQLLPRHPTTFRTHLKHIHQLLSQTVAPTPSSKLGREQATGARPDVTPAVSDAARRLYTQLPCSAPKGATADEWQKSFKKTIENAHSLGDKVFRAVVEDWKSSAREPATANGHTLDDEVQALNADPMSLPPWSGIFAGGERLLGLLSLIKTYILCSTTTPVNLNIGTVVDLLTRLLSLTTSSAKGQGFQNAIKFNNQVSKEERDNLWLILPEIHVAAIDLLLALTQRSDASTTAIDAAMLDQIVWVFASEKDSPEIRTACYLAVAELLLRSGVALPKSSIDPLVDMIRRCCDDLLPLDTNGAQQNQSSAPKTNGTPQATTNADAFLKAPKAANVSGNFLGLQNAAHALLPVLFTHIRPQYLSDSLRARLDRTAILVRDKDAMIASVLNPPPSRKFGKPAASILPFLARNRSGEKEVETLLRPRMPVIRTGTRELDDGADGADEDEEEEIQEEVEGDDGFVGNELDTLLGTAHTADFRGDVAMAEEVDVPATASPSLMSNDRPTTTLESANAMGKRPQEDTASLSPPKRVKVGDEEEHLNVTTLPVQTSATIPTAIVAPNLEAPAVVPDLLAISQDLAPRIIAAAAPPSTKAENAAEEDSDDDDDKISLVLGQDTDSESE